MATEWTAVNLGPPAQLLGALALDHCGGLCIFTVYGCIKAVLATFHSPANYCLHIKGFL